jgi:hypothetical protein
MKYVIRREPTKFQGLMWVCRRLGVVQCAYRYGEDMLRDWADWAL